MLTVSAVADDSPEKAALWKEIAPFFSPPAEFANQFGDLRSPLLFEDGRKVTTPEQWRERRQEILAKWTKLLGEWPPLIEKPEVEILETTRRENITQHKVSFLWTPK
jgi:hypothetical protein